MTRTYEELEQTVRIRLPQLLDELDMTTADVVVFAQAAFAHELTEDELWLLVARLRRTDFQISDRLHPNQKVGSSNLSGRAMLTQRTSLIAAGRTDFQPVCPRSSALH
jgi:hypothetical protein